MADMPAVAPTVFPGERRLLASLGERIKLARLRRKLGAAAVADRAGIARSTVYKVEAGDASTTLGAYVRVLAALGLEKDFEAVAADDKVGRRLQDLELAKPRTRSTSQALRHQGERQ
ncbi:MAG: hypothetical protein NVS2B4_00910 [Ramlibacter sp.]